MDTQTDQNPKQQLVERLRSANNILVTVSTDPSVDQLAACIGLTIWLNKTGKHATAVFSGEVPSTLEFLEPAATLEKNTDSLRDFIIALDKSKADKLRYKVEDRVVKIFITPYRTSLTADDLEFSQGDFNVDAVVAIGVQQQQDLDNAITAHGRILHDATVMTINTASEGGVGSINWHDTQASSLSELVYDVGRELGTDQLDGQIATALLTGIVAETERFSNDKTTPQTMSVSAELMSAGANQQLVASKLDGPSVDLRKAPETAPAETPEAGEAPAKPDDGTLEIEHSRKKSEKADAEAPAPEEDEPVANDLPADEPEEDAGTAPESSDEGNSLSHLANSSKASKLITEPPQLGGMLTANSAPEREEQEPVTDPLSLPRVSDEQPLLSHDEPQLMSEIQEQPEQSAPQAPATEPVPQYTPPPAAWAPPYTPEPTPVLDTQEPVSTSEPAFTMPESAPAVVPEPVAPAPQPEVAAPEAANETLSDLEQAVGSPHSQATEPDAPQLDSARSEVESALNSAPFTPSSNPIEALNAQSVDLNAPAATPDPAQPTVPEPASLAFDPTAFGVINDPSVTQPSTTDSNAPPVPPPLPSDIVDSASQTPKQQ